MRITNNQYSHKATCPILCISNPRFYTSDSILIQFFLHGAQRLSPVAGNNDFFSSLPREKEIMAGNYRVFMTHGHYYYVGSGIEDLKREALARGADVAMFGHTHIPLIEYGDGIVVMNPGSISYPRQEGKRPSYILMDIDKKGMAHYEIEYL